MVDSSSYCCSTGPFTGASIVQSPRDYTADIGGSAVFQCTVGAPDKQTIGFEIFNENITTADSNCITTSTIGVCSRVIESHIVSLTCDYSIGNQINCILSVHDLSRSSDVFCRVLNQSTVEATERAELIVSGMIETSQGN